MSISERFIEFTRRISRKEKSSGFTLTDAIERLRLFAEAGPDGQQSIAEYQVGSTVTLSEFLPGTILREIIRCKDDCEVSVFWCIGEFDKENAQLTIYNVIPRSAQTLAWKENMQVFANKLNTVSPSNGHIVYTVDGNSELFVIARNAKPDPERFTKSVDLMQYGTPAREKTTHSISKSVKHVLVPVGQQIS